MSPVMYSDMTLKVLSPLSKFVVLLTFKATEIKATATVKDWEEDGGSSEEIQ